MMFACVHFAFGQINTGSDGSDGVFDPTAANVVINMADHLSGIYQYTSVNISNGVTVTFIPNAANTPVTWLVQGNCVINGTVNVSGQACIGNQGGLGGPGGYAGGNGTAGNPATGGKGPGGGPPNQSGNYDYANAFLVPLLGGSGGGGADNCQYGGGGGSGSMLIAASNLITINGNIIAAGGPNSSCWPVAGSGSGSGGGIRLVASQIMGTGTLTAARVRFDTYDKEFTGIVSGAQFSEGFQPIIIPSAGQLPQLTVTSVGGVPVSPSPTGALSTPDAILSAQQNNPIPIVVQCQNLPLNTPITVSVKPANSFAVTASGANTTGTLASSSATVLINIPRGGGLIYATAGVSN